MIKIDIELVRGRLHTPYDIKKHQNIHLVDSPHWLFLNKKKFWYKAYLSYSHQPEHSVYNFEKLIENFDFINYEPIIVKKENNYFIILDGFHRLWKFD